MNIVKKIIGEGNEKDAVDKIGEQVGPYDMNMAKKIWGNNDKEECEHHRKRKRECE